MMNHKNNNNNNQNYKNNKSRMKKTIKTKVCKKINNQYQKMVLNNKKLKKKVMFYLEFLVLDK